MRSHRSAGHVPGSDRPARRLPRRLPRRESYPDLSIAVNPCVDEPEWGPDVIVSAEVDPAEWPAWTDLRVDVRAEAQR